MYLKGNSELIPLRFSKPIITCFATEPPQLFYLSLHGEEKYLDSSDESHYSLSVKGK